MTEKNETSFQAGEPMPNDAPGGPSEPSIEMSAPTPFDQLLATLKAHESWGLAAGVGVQILVLFAMILMGGMKAAFGGF